MQVSIEHTCIKLGALKMNIKEKEKKIIFKTK